MSEKRLSPCCFAVIWDMDCPACEGQGEMGTDNTECPECEGNGYIDDCYECSECGDTLHESDIVGIGDD